MNNRQHAHIPQDDVDAFIRFTFTTKFAAAQALLDKHGVDLVDKGGALWKGADPSSALVEATSAAKIPVMKFLVERGADVNQQDELGWTPLMVAALGCKTEAILFLMDNGAKVYTANKRGETAADLARRHETHAREGMAALKEGIKRQREKAAQRTSAIQHDVQNMHEGISQELSVQKLLLRKPKR